MITPRFNQHVKPAAEFLFEFYGTEYFKNAEEAENFLRFNVQKNYMATDYVVVIAESKRKGWRVNLGEMPGLFYNDWKKAFDAWNPPAP